MVHARGCYAHAMTAQTIVCREVTSGTWPDFVALFEERGTLVIEDDVLITQRGHEVLTEDVFPTDLDEIRALMGS